MDSLFGQIFNFLVSPPGSLAYHLVLVFAIMAAGQGIFFQQQSGGYGSSNRTLIGLGLLLLLQLVLFVAGGYAWLQTVDSHLMLPVMERGLATLSLILIGWLWVFPRQRILHDIFTAALSGLVIIYFIATLSLWSLSYSSIPFNSTLLEMVWSILSVVISLSGIVLLVILKPQSWGTGAAMMGLIFLGSLVQLFAPQPDSDYAAPLRLAYLCAFPILPALMQRCLPGSTPQPAPETPPSSTLTLDLKNQPSAEPKTVLAWLQVARQDDPGRASLAVARALAQTMRADKCYLVSAPQADGTLQIVCGHDLIHEIDLHGNTLEGESFLTLSQAISQGESLILEPDHAEHQQLRETMGIENCDLLVMPLGSSERHWGAAFLLAPYTRRHWDSRDQEYLAMAAPAIVSYLEGLETPLARKATLSIEEDLKSMPSVRADENWRKAIETQPGGMAKVPVRWFSEIRKAMDSIHGYTGLLLAGSTGVLGSQQRSILEQVLGFSTRQRELAEAFLENPESPKVTDPQLPTNLNGILDGAIADINTALRKKKLSLRLRLAEPLPIPAVPQEPLRLMVNQMIQDAANRSPNRSTLILESGLLQEGGRQGLHVTITRTPSQKGEVPARLPQAIELSEELEGARIMAESYRGSLSVMAVEGGAIVHRLELPVEERI